MDEFLRLNVEQINRIARGEKIPDGELAGLVALMPAPTDANLDSVPWTQIDGDIALYCVPVEVTA